MNLYGQGHGELGDAHQIFNKAAGPFSFALSMTTGLNPIFQLSSFVKGFILLVRCESSPGSPTTLQRCILNVSRAVSKSEAVMSLCEKTGSGHSVCVLINLFPGGRN